MAEWSDLGGSANDDDSTGDFELIEIDSSIDEEKTEIQELSGIAAFDSTHQYERAAIEDESPSIEEFDSVDAEIDLNDTAEVASLSLVDDGNDPVVLGSAGTEVVERRYVPLFQRPSVLVGVAAALLAVTIFSISQIEEGRFIVFEGSPDIAEESDEVISAPVAEEQGQAASEVELLTTIDLDSNREESVSSAEDQSTTDDEESDDDEDDDEETTTTVDEDDEDTTSSRRPIFTMVETTTSPIIPIFTVSTVGTTPTTERRTITTERRTTTTERRTTTTERETTTTTARRTTTTLAPTTTVGPVPVTNVIRGTSTGPDGQLVASSSLTGTTELVSFTASFAGCTDEDVASIYADGPGIPRTLIAEGSCEDSLGGSISGLDSDTTYEINIRINNKWVYQSRFAS